VPIGNMVIIIKSLRLYSGEIVTFLFIILIVSLLFYVFRDRTNELKPGQIWVWEYNSDNPYAKKIIHYDKIISTNGKYLLYVEDGKDTVSDKKLYFMETRKIIKK